MAELQREEAPIRDAETRQIVVASLLYPVAPSYLEWADSLWQPALRESLASQPELPDHSHWRWAWKLTEYSEGKLGFAIEHEGKPQALMVVQTSKLARLSSQIGEPLLYIDYLATAPWNDFSLTPTPLYRACGTALWQAAIEYSQKQGWQGRLGLHSLPQAEGYYRKLGILTDLGIDDQYDNLRYFEAEALKTP
jgi:hypothetical protein